MNEYAFPTDLLDAIKARWQPDPRQHFKLPNDRILARLLETCYHASLRTSEQRAVRCVVACASPADIPEGTLRLSRPVVLTDSELVRLSPVTQHRQTVIGCEQENGWLRIWGFFDHRHAWVQHSAGDPPAAPIQLDDLPPDCLSITIEGPGALTVSQGRTGLLRLRNGRVIFPQEEDLFQSVRNPLGKFFHELIDDLLTATQRRDLSVAVETSAGQRTFLNIYTTSILAILERIRLTQHGGSIVITRVPFNAQLAHVTYTAFERTGLAGEIIAYKTLDDLLRKPRSSFDADELERCQSELELHRTSRRLIRGISRISLLAAVDGAVLLDDHLRIQGFGVRFPVLLPPGTTVLDALTGVEYLFDQWGLRHQSVFSVCHNCEQAVGLIVSQDGDVKVAKAVDGQLMFWDGILD